MNVLCNHLTLACMAMRVILGVDTPTEGGVEECENEGSNPCRGELGLNVTEQIAPAPFALSETQLLSHNQMKRSLCPACYSQFQAITVFGKRTLGLQWHTHQSPQTLVNEDRI